MACALQSCSHHSLVLWACAGAIMRQNLGMRRHKSADGLSVFVIDNAYFVAAKIADFFSDWLHLV